MKNEEGLIIIIIIKTYYQIYIDYKQNKTKKIIFNLYKYEKYAVQFLYKRRQHKKLLLLDAL